MRLKAPSNPTLLAMALKYLWLAKCPTTGLVPKTNGNAVCHALMHQTTLDMLQNLSPYYGWVVNARG